ARRLPEVGYRFADPGAAHVPPSAQDVRLITEIEGAVGPLPLSFRAFYEVVGSVNFCQSLAQLVAWHAGQGKTPTEIETLRGEDEAVPWNEERRKTATEIETLGEEDPLYVLPLSALHADLMAALSSNRRRGRYARFGWRQGGEDRWYCHFAPDEYHKANYSG